VLILHTLKFFDNAYIWYLKEIRYVFLDFSLVFFVFAIYTAQKLRPSNTKFLSIELNLISFENKSQ
jgi:hypothetical protein